MRDRRSADLGVKLAEAMDCEQSPGSVAEPGLKIKLTEIMLDHHMQHWLNSKNIKKTDVLDRRMPKIITSIMPIYHAGHWLYESKKGKVSLMCFMGRNANATFPYEIYSWGKLFEDMELFETQGKAERRIIEVLG